MGSLGGLHTHREEFGFVLLPANLLGLFDDIVASSQATTTEMCRAIFALTVDNRGDYEGRFNG